MSEYAAEVVWELGEAEFANDRYSRGHRWLFDGGIEVPASSSPHVVPVPLSVEAAVDPEEAFVASLASCHMLWFLSLAARRGWKVGRYRDAARGSLEKDGRGRLAITRVDLRPEVSFAGDEPAWAELEAVHREAHERCFLANSVRAEVRCEPRRPG